jgi:hypothetical protein
MSSEKLYSNNSNAMSANFATTPLSSKIKMDGDISIETPSRVMIVANDLKKEYLVLGFLLNAAATLREAVIIKNNLDEVLEVSMTSFFKTYRLVKTYREGVTPEVIYLDGIPDKVTSGQHWVPKDTSTVNPFNYSESNTYASDETPDTVWEVQSVAGDEVTLNLVKQEEHTSGQRNRTNTGQILKLTKRELVTNYRLHSHGFFLSNDFFKFIQNETYVSPENKDKIYMMTSDGRGEYIQIDDMVGMPKKNNVNVDNLI